MAVYGYARVSSAGQNLGAQIEALRNAGCEIIREEKRTGTTVEGRTELRTLIDFARAGDQRAYRNFRVRAGCIRLA